VAPHLWNRPSVLDASLKLYLREIQSDPLLTAEEEAALADRIAMGDDAARDRLIQANLRLVVKIARQFMGRGLSLEDLIGEGNLGLIRATQDFDPRFGTRFSTYSAHWIKQAIRSALITTTATIRLPSHMVSLLNRWQRADRQLSRSLGRPAQFDEIAGALNLSHSQQAMVRQALLSKLVQYDTADPDGLRICGRAIDHRPSPATRLDHHDEHRALLRRLELLEDRDRLVLTLRFGLYGERPHTLSEVGEIMGITREWVRRIEQRAVRMLDPVHQPRLDYRASHGRL